MKVVSILYVLWQDFRLCAILGREESQHKAHKAEGVEK